MIISKTFRFEAAHRLPLHKGLCRHLHGHSYRVEVLVQAPVDDSTGMAVDFHDLKTLQNWIDTHLDHATLVWTQDEELKRFLRDGCQRHFVTERPPTAEVLCSVIRDQLSGYRVHSIRIWETETCSAIDIP